MKNIYKTAGSVGILFLVFVIIAMFIGNWGLAVVFAMLGLILVVIPIRARYQRKEVWQRQHAGLHGSAEFADKKEIEYFDPNTLAWGESLALGWVSEKNWSPKLDPRYRVSKKHILTMAPTGSGKGIGCVIPTLLEYRGNVVCLDLKGENWAVTHARREAMGHRVIKLDPFGVCTGKTDTINVLDWLYTFSDDIISDALMFADSFVLSDRKDGRVDHWDESTKNLLQALFIHAIEKNLGLADIRDIVCKSGDAFFGAIEPMIESPIPVVRRCAESYIEKEPKELSNLLSGTIRHTAILDEQKIVKVLNTKDSGFSFENLKRSNVDIYIIIPPERVNTYGRYIRLIVSLCLTAVSRVKGPRQVLFLLDEICQIGRLDLLESAVSLMRGYGAFFWMIVQDLGQLKGVYGPKWSTFFANSVRQFFGTTDYDTAKYLSDSLGNKTVFYTSIGTSGVDSDKESESESESMMKKPLMSAAEISLMEPTEALIFEQSKKPAKVRKLNYLEDDVYKGLADNNPMHQNA